MRSFVLSAVALTAVIFTAHSCAGTRAREHVLLPVVQEVWPSVREDIDRGLKVFAESGADAVMFEHATVEVSVLRESLRLLDLAIVAGDRAAIKAADWKSLEVTARIGIADQVMSGEIGELVADSLLQRLDEFARAITTLGENLQ
jgi:hypothetical protein